MEIFVKEGRNVKFECCNVTEATWTHNDGNLQNNSKHIYRPKLNKDVLLIWNVTAENSGIYECRGTINNQIVRAAGRLDVESKSYYWFTDVNTTVFTNV